MQAFSAPYGLPGWRRSADRMGLPVNSLLTGNFTGKYAISELSGAISCRETAVPQRLFKNYSTKINSENFQENREFPSGDSESTNA
jgi:hypothetical protein